MKKVLVVATVVKLHIMVFHIPILEWFKKNGYEVHVAARNDYANKEECNIPFCDEFFDLPFERSPLKKNNLITMKELKKLMDDQNYDIIHCHTPVGGALARIAAHKSKDNSAKVIYTAHGFHFFKGAPLINWLVYYPIERWLARYTDVLITINKEDYERARGFKAKRVEYVPGVGIDIGKFNAVKVDKVLKRKELGLPEESFVVLSVGELNKNKNHEVVIKALAEMKNTDIHYIICGQGGLEDYLKNISKELGVEKQVHLLGFRKDIVEICKMSDVFVFPSFREGLSVALMEAMACGLPVICSNIRGNSDLIEDGRGGYLVDPDEISGYKESVSQLYDSVELRNNFKEWNLEAVRQYSVENIISNIKEIYEDY